MELQKRKVGDGVAYMILDNGKIVGHISGFEKPMTVNGPQAFVPAFHMYKTELSGSRDAEGSVHGTGIYQAAVQQVANKYPGGLFVYEWESSSSLKKALVKMSTLKRVDKALVIVPNASGLGENVKKLREEFGFGGLTTAAAAEIPEEETAPPTSCEFYDTSGFCKVNEHLCPHFECTFHKCVVREHALMLQRGDYQR